MIWKGRIYFLQLRVDNVDQKTHKISLPVSNVVYVYLQLPTLALALTMLILRYYSTLVSRPDPRCIWRSSNFRLEARLHF